MIILYLFAYSLSAEFRSSNILGYGSKNEFIFIPGKGILKNGVKQTIYQQTREFEYN